MSVGALPRSEPTRAPHIVHALTLCADFPSSYQSIGRGALDNALKGFNACIFAYGQTGSGKTHSMMGSADQPGIVPRLCRDLFKHTESNTSDLMSFTVEVSYLEIYNEQVFDLLTASQTKGKALRTRNHKTLGPYVEGLSKFAVGDYESVEKFIESGNAMRTTKSTKMNDTSSRSHAIFSLVVKQVIKHAGGNKAIGEKVSKISLVDLAGSERQSKTGATGDRLKEGSTINKSLTTLGMVIAALADRSSGASKGKAVEHIPYRDSALTFLLKESLGGNSKTVMIAAISPAADNFDESMSTLRYADRAKRIVNKAFVNEDATAAIIKSLRDELDQLRSQVGSASTMSNEEISKLRAEMEENERLLKEANLSWEEKLRATECELRERAERAELMVEEKILENESLRREMALLQAEKERLASEAAAARDAASREKDLVRIEQERIFEEKLVAERERAKRLEATLAQTSRGAEDELEKMRQAQAALEKEVLEKEALAAAEREARLATEAEKALTAARLEELRKVEQERITEIEKMERERFELVANIEKAEAAKQAELTALAAEVEAKRKSRIAAEEDWEAKLMQEREKVMQSDAMKEKLRVLEEQRLLDEAKDRKRQDEVKQLEEKQQELRAQLDQVQRAKAMEIATLEQERQELAAVAQAQKVEVEDWEVRLAQEKERGIALEQSLASSASSTQHRDQEIERMRQAQAELELKLKEQEARVESEQKARLAIEAEKNEAAARAAELCAKQEQRDKALQQMEKERAALAEKLKNAENAEQAALTAHKTEEKEDEDWMAKLERARQQADREAAEREEAERQRVEAQKELEKKDLEIKKLRSLFLEKESDSSEKVESDTTEENSEYSHDQASAQSLTQRGKAPDWAPENRMVKRESVSKVHGDLMRQEIIGGAAGDKWRTADLHERELASKRLEVEKLKAEQDELRRKIQAKEAQEAYERQERLRSQVRLRELEKERVAQQRLREEGEARVVEEVKREAEMKIEESLASIEIEKREAEALAAREAAKRAELEQKLELERLAEEEKMEALIAERESMEKIKMAEEAAKRKQLEDELELQRQSVEASKAALAEKEEEAAALANKVAAATAPKAPTRQKSRKLQKRAKSVKMLDKPAELPELSEEKSAGLISYLKQLEEISSMHHQVRTQANAEASQIMLGMDQVKKDSEKAADKVRRISETGSERESSSVESAKGSKTLKIGMDLKQIEDKAKADIALCDSRVSVILQAAERIKQANLETEKSSKALLFQAQENGVAGEELIFLQRKCENEVFTNNQALSQALEVAAAIEAIKEQHAKTLEQMQPLFVHLLGVSDELDREKLVQAAEAEKKAKHMKRRASIKTFSHADFGDSSEAKRANLEKFLCQEMHINSVQLAQHMKVGKHVMQGWLFKPTKEKYDRWNRRFFLLDLREKKVTWSEQTKKGTMAVKGDIMLRDIITCAPTEVEKITRRKALRDDGGSVDFIFSVVTQKRVWYFSAASKMEMDLWVCVFNAMTA